jgi:hypothetical protein
MLACTEIPTNANGVKLPCRLEYAPFPASVCRIGRSCVAGRGLATPAQLTPAASGTPRRLLPVGLIGDSAVVAGGYLAAFLRAESMLVQ